MEYRPLDITVISAEGLKNVNMFMKMGVFVVVSLNDDSVSKKKTHISYSDSNLKWNHRIKITLEESSISDKSLLFQIKCSRILGDKDIGEVMVPLRELFDGVGSVDKSGDNVVTYTVRTPRGKCKGNLKFSYKFGDVFVQGGETGHKRNNSDGSNIGDGSTGVYAESNVTYQPPPGGMIYASPQYSPTGYPTPHGYTRYHVYPPPPPQYDGGYNNNVYPPPPQQYSGGYNNVYPPVSHGTGGYSGEFPRIHHGSGEYSGEFPRIHHGSGGYSGEFPRIHHGSGGYSGEFPRIHHGSGGYSGEFPRASPNRYLYAPQQVGNGYDGEYPNHAQVQQPNNEKVVNTAKLGLGLGAGLIGGLLVGEMISDIGDMASTVACNTNVVEDAVVAVD